MWSQSEIVVRDVSPKISSLSFEEGSLTINITGAPDTAYLCKTSSDLETFSSVTTNPEILTLDSRGKMDFTVDAGDAGRFFVLEEAPLE